MTGPGAWRAGARRPALAIAVCLLCAACGARSSAATSQPQGQGIPANAATQSRTYAGMTVTLTASPARAAADARVSFRLQLSARSAAGALAYRIGFGDGSSRQNIVPEFCRASPSGPERGSWEIPHRYAKAGSYRATLYGSVNCQRSSRAAVTVTVVIT